MVYGHYVSPIVQKPMRKTLLPDHEGSGHGVPFGIRHAVPTLRDVSAFEAEPSREYVIAETLPLVLDLMVYEHLLEAKASEHAARMVAMKNAKDSAGKKVSSLTLTYNKARQAAITKEVSEIVSGVESMKE
jgi:F-type H+-transporting ATPase subunit gamma